MAWGLHRESFSAPGCDCGGDWEKRDLGTHLVRLKHQVEELDICGQRERVAFLQPLCNGGSGKDQGGDGKRWGKRPKRARWVASLDWRETWDPRIPTPAPKLMSRTCVGLLATITLLRVSTLLADTRPEWQLGDAARPGVDSMWTACGHVIGGIYLGLQEAPQCLGEKQRRAGVSSSDTTTSELELRRMLNSNLASKVIMKLHVSRWENESDFI